MTTLLYSGGLDSACAWWLLGKPRVLHLGGKNGPARDAWEAEGKAIDEQCRIWPEFAKALRRVEIDCRPFMRPGAWRYPRDQICCITAWALGCDSVVIGWCADDNTPPYWARIQKARYEGAVGEDDFKVSFPLLGSWKRDMVQRALALGAPLEFLAASYSCVVSSTPCGQCLGCTQREAALGGLMVKT